MNRSTRRHGVPAAADIERAAHNERDDQQGATGTAGKRRNKDRQFFGLGLDHRVLVYNLLAAQRLAGLRVVGLHVGNVAVGRRRLHLYARLLLSIAALPGSWGSWESFSLIAAILSSNNQRPAKHVAGIIVHVELYPNMRANVYENAIF